MNCGRWIAASLCVVLLAVSVPSAQAANITGNMWVAECSYDASGNLQILSPEDSMDNLRSAINLGIERDYGSPAWKLTEEVEGSGYYTGTFALYVELGADLTAWNYVKGITSKTITFGTTSEGDATWSVTWNNYSSNDHSEGATPPNIWTNKDFLFAHVGVAESDPDEAPVVDFFSDSGDNHALTIGGDGRPLGTAGNVGRTEGSQWLLGVFDVEVSGATSPQSIVLGDSEDGYLQGREDSTGATVQNLVFALRNLYYDAENPTTYNPFDASLTPVEMSNPNFVVPEPGTYAMLCGLGLIGAAWYRRNRKKA